MSLPSATHPPAPCLRLPDDPSLPMTMADSDQLWMPAEHDPWFALAEFLAKEVEALKTDPRFAAEVCSVAGRLAIPLPAAVVSDRTCSAVARRCSDLVASGEFRRAAALLAGHRLAIERWFRLRGARWRDADLPGHDAQP